MTVPNRDTQAHPRTHAHAVNASMQQRALTVVVRAGLPAVVFQHELDHLDGLLETDREVKVYADKPRDAMVADAHTLYLKDLLKYYNISVSSAMAPDDC